MKTLISSIALIAGIGLVVGGVEVSLAAEEDSQTKMETKTHQLNPKFPKSDKCSTSSPCRDVVGTIVKIEESYWIRMPNGNETHLRVSPETKIESSVKVGDPIAAQLTASGDADAIMKLKELPKADELAAPKGSLKEMR